MTGKFASLQLLAVRLRRMRSAIVCMGWADFSCFQNSKLNLLLLYERHASKRFSFSFLFTS